MLKKVIKYTDFDGNEREETFYFNMTKAEVSKLEFSTSGGIKNLIEKIVAEQDGEKIINFFQNFIALSYGEKSLDGRNFMKSEEILNKFISTEAYSQLFMELGTNAEAAAIFVSAVLPKDNPPPKTN